MSAVSHLVRTIQTHDITGLSDAEYATILHGLRMLASDATRVGPDAGIAEELVRKLTFGGLGLVCCVDCGQELTTTNARCIVCSGRYARRQTRYNAPISIDGGPATPVRVASYTVTFP